MSANPQRKFCRACLKEIRNTVTRINSLLEQPSPVVQLRDGQMATSYLQCYYYCLRIKANNVNGGSLMDYAYICMKCKSQLLRTVEFLVKSQRNEDFLMSMYDKSTHDTTSTTTTDFEDELFGNIHNKHKTLDEYGDNTSSTPCEEDENDIVETLDPVDDLLYSEDSEWEMSEVEALSTSRPIEVQEHHAEDKQDSISPSDVLSASEQDLNDISHKENALDSDILEILAEVEKEDENSNGIEVFEQVLIDTSNEVDKSLMSTRKTCNRNAFAKSINKEKITTTTANEKRLYFKCELCRKVFKLQSLLFEHYDNEHDDSSFGYPCDACKIRYISAEALEIHTRRNHKKVSYDDCQICGKLILSAFLKSHSSDHNKDVRYECLECDRSFATKGAILKHRKSIHGNAKVSRYNCNKCERYFFSSSKLKIHTRIHSEEETNLENSETTYLCDVCSKTFTNKYQLKHHVQMHRGETMKCPHCEKQFVNLRDMRIHIRFHTKEYPFNCDACSRKFAIKSHLDLHRKQQHEGVRYKCTICNKEFGHTVSLTHHSYKHRGYPHSCKLCSKGFPSLFKLRVHLKNAHSDIFPGEFSEKVADQYCVRNNIGTMYPRVEIVGDAE